MNAAKKIATPVEVLARLDTHTRQPVMFLRSTIDSKGNITIWRNGAEEKSTVDFYGTTAPLNGKDERTMRKRFADAYGITEEEVIINKRLPRTPRDRASVVRELPAPAPAAQQPGNLPPQLANLTPEALAALMALLQPAMPPAATPAPAAQEQAPAAAPAANGSAPALTLVHDASAPAAPAAAPAPAAAQEQQPATEQQQQEAQPQQPRRRLTKKEKAAKRSEAARKGAATRAANRTGNAKSIDAQPAPGPVSGDLPRAGEQPAPMPPAAPVVEASPAEVVEAILDIRQRFNSELEAVLQKLTPKK